MIYARAASFTYAGALYHEEIRIGILFLFINHVSSAKNIKKKTVAKKKNKLFLVQNF